MRLAWSRRRSRPDAIRGFILAVLLVAGSSTSITCGADPRAPAPTPDPATRRVLPAGEVVGFTNAEGAHVWRGIPFARPPEGPLRWRAPLAPAPLSAPLQALQPAAPCMQLAGPGGASEGLAEGTPRGSEDCLYLDIYAPPRTPEAATANSGDERLPVMMWIHGGGNTIGDTRLYDASRLATRQQVIVVNVQYRLGLLGWFHHPALVAEPGSAADRSGNFGTLDHIRALEWIHENIAAFGGDPARVTVFGESAGGQNVFALLLSPLARGLFQRAISQSGGVWTSTHAEASLPAERGGHELSSSEVLLALLIDDGTAADRVSARAHVAALDSGAVAAYLRGKTAHDLLAVVSGESFGGMYSAPSLLRDGHVLPAEPPEEVFRDPSRYNVVPTILGSNRDENKLFLLFTSPAMTRVFGVPLYLNDPERYAADAEYQSLMWKWRGVDQPAGTMRTGRGPTLYAYRFDWDEEPKRLWADFSRWLGAAHAIELPFVFGYQRLGRATPVLFDDTNRPGARKLSDQMMSYWAEFAYAGAPGRGRDGRNPRWKPWEESSGDADRYLVLDTDAGGGVRMEGEVVPRDRILARLLADPRLADFEARCEILRAFVRFAQAMTPAEYREIAGAACNAWPL